MDTLGVVESRSIAAGVAMADGMLKVAAVSLVRAATICSGRYLIYISGDRQAVETSVRFAEASGKALLGSFVISNISTQVLDALKKAATANAGDAIGVIECRTVAAGINAADVAVKRSAVGLLRIVTGQGINGKSYFVLGGDVASVREAAAAAQEVLGNQLLEMVVIPRPEADVVRSLTTGVR